MRDHVDSTRGFTLTELMVSMAIMLTVTGAIFSLVNPSQGIARVQPEYSDMQQRARVGADTLLYDLSMSGAGPYLGADTGNLSQYFAPVVPYRLGINADATRTPRSDSITLVYVPTTSAQTTAFGEVKAGSELTVNAQDHCEGGKANQLCGFKEGMSVLIIDPLDGAYDTFEITHVQDQASKLQHRGVHWSKGTYPGGATVTEVRWVHYYWDQNQLQLRRYDGIATDLPVLDNVVGLEFQYFGDPNPPVTPRPRPFPQENCLYDAGGGLKLPRLASASSSLMPLPLALFSDHQGAALCGAGTNAFDPDLLRVRQIRVRLRVQASDPSMRPTAASLSADANLRALFQRPGTGAVGMGGFVPDYELQFDVTPRNLNLER